MRNFENTIRRSAVLHVRLIVDCAMPRAYSNGTCSVDVSTIR